MNKKLLIIIACILVVGAVGFYAYPVVKNRYFSSPSPDNNSDSSSGPSDQSGNDSSGNAVQGDPDDEDASGGDGSQEAVDIQPEKQEDLPANTLGQKVTDSDCDKECKSFTNPEEMKYCQQVCGFYPDEKKESSSDCEKLSGLDKDYCLKDVAVTKGDYDACGAIQDAKVRKTCQNRVSEDFLDRNFGGQVDE